MTEDADRIASWDELPPGVRACIGPALPPGHTVWACPSDNGRGGVHIEWWWLDEDEELIEVFWIE